MINETPINQRKEANPKVSIKGGSAALFLEYKKIPI